MLLKEIYLQEKRNLSDCQRLGVPDQWDNFTEEAVRKYMNVIITEDKDDKSYMAILLNNK